MKLRYKQRGMTFFGAALGLFLGVFFLTLLFKLAPVYMEHSKIKTSLEAVKAEKELTSNTRDMIIDMINKRLYINGVQLLPQDMTVIKHGGYLKIQIAYDRVVPLFGNLDVVAHFNDVHEMGTESSN